LNDSEKWNLEKIDEVIQTGKTSQVQIKKEVYIHILYWTAWSENGTLQFRDDLYSLDMDLYKKLD